MIEQATPFDLDLAVAELRPLGIVLRQAPGGYLVNHIHGTDETAYGTDELADAVAQGREMVKTPLPPPWPPLGPTGRRMTRRSVMLKHNNKLAARRRRQAAKAAKTAAKSPPQGKDD